MLMFEKLEGFQSIDLLDCRSMIVFYKDGHIAYSNDVFVPNKGNASHVIFLKQPLSPDESFLLISSIERVYSVLKGVFPSLLCSLCEKKEGENSYAK